MIFSCTLSSLIDLFCSMWLLFETTNEATRSDLIFLKVKVKFE